MDRHAWSRIIFLLILVVFALYAWRFIQRTSFVLEGERYYVLFDDAMISMRYARNLAAGHGPVWNPGERVEGFTNPLWVAWMGAVHLLPLPSRQVSLVVQISGAVLLIANLLFVKKTGREVSGSAVVSLLAVFLTAFYFSLNNWTLQGMEVGLVTLLITASAWGTIRALKQKEFVFWPYLALALGTWVRLDVAVAYLAFWLFLLVFDPDHRRQHLTWGLGLLAASLLVQTVARGLYYGELLPNTYFLKMGGYSLIDRLKRGLTVYWQFLWTMNWLVFVIPFTILLLKPSRATGLLLFIFVAQSAYSVYVGGDAWEHKGGANRFISSAMPGFFILFVLALDLIRRAILRAAAWEARWLPVVSQIVMVGLVIASLFSVNTLLEQDSFQKWITIKRPVFVQGNEKHTKMGLLVADLTTDQASIAVVSAGAIPYFSERYAIDLLGKADKVIAQGEPRSLKGISDDEDFRPGHNKWDYAYSIGLRQPDLVVQLWSHPEEAEPYLKGYQQIKVGEFSMYFKSGSPNIRWENIP